MSVNFADEVREYLLTTPMAAATMLQVAKRYDMSAQTLRRRLRAEGINFNTIYHSVFRARVTQLAILGATGPEIADVLGYLDRNSFYRMHLAAFGSKWSDRGQTPSECESFPQPHRS